MGSAEVHGNIKSLTHCVETENLKFKGNTNGENGLQSKIVRKGKNTCTDNDQPKYLL